MQLDDNSILQEYVYPRGPKACVTRVVYHTKHSSEMKANFGFKLRSKFYLDQISERLGIEDIATVNKGEESKVNSFTVNKLSGVSLIEYEHYSNELVAFLERVR